MSTGHKPFLLPIYLLNSGSLLNGIFSLYILSCLYSAFCEIIQVVAVFPGLVTELVCSQHTEVGLSNI